MKRIELYTDVNGSELGPPFPELRWGLVWERALFSCLFLKETHQGIGPLHAFLGDVINWECLHVLPSSFQ